MDVMDPMDKAEPETTKETVDRRESVRFHVTADRMADVELGALLDIQENPNDPRLMASFMAKFVADEDGNYLPEDEAMQAVRRVTIGQIKSAFEQVTGDLVETAVPNG